MKTSFPNRPVLLVDDESNILEGYQQILSKSGITNLLCFTDSREALAVIAKEELDAAILDLNMPHVSGEELLQAIFEQQPGVPVIVVTGRQDVETAVQCMKLGAHDYLVKPVSGDRIAISVRNVLRLRELQRESKRLSQSLFTEELHNPAIFSEMVTQNAEMKSLFLYIEAIAESTHPVLITGETGTGKELIAKAIHKASNRQGTFVACNVASLDDHTFSDTLFGHKRGAFTGAESSRAGLVASAAGGTLFLDEIGDLHPASQVKLLRLIQEHEYMPLGDDNPIRTDTRVVVATNADLDAVMAQNRFRKDLYFRLNTHKIRLPPLRERMDDLPLLVDHFLQRAADKLKKKSPTPPKELIPLLSLHDFPGNIRELEGMIMDAVSRHTSHVLSLQSFKTHMDAQRKDVSITSSENISPRSETECAGITFATFPRLAEARQLLAEEALRRTNGNISRAAELLGITRQGLIWHFKRHPSKPSE